MNKRLALTMCVLIMSEHNKSIYEKNDNSVSLEAPSIDASIDDLKKPISAFINEHLLKHIAADKDSEYTVLISCKVGDQSGKVVAKLDLDKFSGEKLYTVLKNLYSFSDNLSDKLCDKIRCIVMKTTGFSCLYL